MAFPAPAGIIAGPEIVRSLADAPRWASVRMTETQVARPADDLLVLAYRAEGRRDGATPYRAYCTSTYRLTDDGRWRLVQHQQTPS
jgi:ketosteroid isomerase-like protein